MRKDKRFGLAVCVAIILILTKDIVTILPLNYLSIIGSIVPSINNDFFGMYFSEHSMTISLKLYLWLLRIGYISHLSGLIVLLLPKTKVDKRKVFSSLMLIASMIVIGSTWLYTVRFLMEPGIVLWVILGLLSLHELLPKKLSMEKVSLYKIAAVLYTVFAILWSIDITFFPHKIIFLATYDLYITQGLWSFMYVSIVLFSYSIVVHLKELHKLDKVFSISLLIYTCLPLLLLTIQNYFYDFNIKVGFIGEAFKLIHYIALIPAVSLGYNMISEVGRPLGKKVVYLISFVLILFQLCLILTPLDEFIVLKGSYFLSRSILLLGLTYIVASSKGPNNQNALINND